MPEAIGRRGPVVQATWGRNRSVSPILSASSSCEAQCTNQSNGPAPIPRPGMKQADKKVARPTYIDPRWSGPPVHDVLWPLAGLYHDIIPIGPGGPAWTGPQSEWTSFATSVTKSLCFRISIDGADNMKNINPEKNSMTISLKLPCNCSSIFHLHFQCNTRFQ